MRNVGILGKQINSLSYYQFTKKGESSPTPVGVTMDSMLCHFTTIFDSRKWYPNYHVKYFLTFSVFSSGKIDYPHPPLHPGFTRDRSRAGENANRQQIKLQNINKVKKVRFITIFQGNHEAEMLQNFVLMTMIMVILFCCTLFLTL